MKRVQNYPDFEKLAHLVWHGPQGFIVKNIVGESPKACHAGPQNAKPASGR